MGSDGALCRCRNSFLAAHLSNKLIRPIITSTLNPMGGKDLTQHSNHQPFYSKPCPDFVHGFSGNDIHDLVVSLIVPHTGTKLIQALAREVDELTTVVVERAGEVSRNPGNRRAREELDTLRRQWASKVQELTQVIDDIIDPEDFMAQSGLCMCRRVM